MVNRARERLRRRMSAASPPLKRVFTGTSTAPACQIPSAARIHSTLLNDQMATRSPGPIRESLRSKEIWREPVKRPAGVREHADGPSTTDRKEVESWQPKV